MLQLTNKNKLYLYLFFLIFLSSIFNFKFLESYQNKFILKKINITGLSYDEKKLIEIELNNFKNINIFKLSEEKIFRTLNNFNFLENIHVKKIIPSTLNISLSKTKIVGKTIKNGKSFYIGGNEKLISSSQIFESKSVPSVFGEFKLNEYVELQNILIKYQLHWNMTEKYFFYKNKRWDISFKNGITLKLPSKNKSKSIKIYKQLLDNGILLNTKIVDLRVPDQIILTNYNE